MSFKALFLTSEYLPPGGNISLPLISRFPSHKIGYLSMGPAGVGTAVIKTGKHGISIENTVSNAVPVSPQVLGDACAALKKKVSSFIGQPPVVICHSSNLFWQVKENTGFASQENFIQNLRSDPQRVLGGVDDNFCYIGIQHNSGAAVVFGIPKAEIALAREVATSKGLNPVRETVPALAMFNLLLADPRVVSREMTPVVVDQGFVIAVTSNDSGWDSIVARGFSAGNSHQQEAIVKEFADDLISRGSKKLLVASSSLTCGIDAETHLKSQGAEVSAFTVGNLTSEQLFAYATSLF